MTSLRERVMRWDRRGDPAFHWRGGEVSRLEGFSDAVFGFALTLLVVTQSVPHSFDELMSAMRGMLSFAICFILLLGVWRRHYRYFRRFGLEDSSTVILNGLLLFLVVFYVYPLKFLFSLVVDGMLGVGDAPVIHGASQVRTLFIIYGAGFSAIFALYAGLYQHAWRLRDRLELDELERLATRHEIAANLAMAAVGMLSIALALVLPASLAGFAGFAYFAVGVVETWHGARVGDTSRRFRDAAAPSPAAPAPARGKRRGGRRAR